MQRVRILECIVVDQNTSCLAKKQLLVVADSLIVTIPFIGKTHALIYRTFTRSSVPLLSVFKIPHRFTTYDSINKCLIQVQKSL